MTLSKTAQTFGPPALFGALALFFIQPLAGKALTPRLGGGAGIWLTCMVFFQTTLLLGYLLAHVIAGLARRRQVPAWGLLALAAWALIAWNGVLAGNPFLPAPAWSLDPARHPILTLLGLLAFTYGAPFLLLATLSPLLQAWLAGANVGSPFRYYALSNLGSFLGLLAYPFVAEPLLSTPGQARLLCLFLALVTGLGLRAGLASRDGSAAAPAEAAAPADPAESAHGDATLTWIFASAAGSLLLVACSNAMSSVLSIPLVWIAPLGAYLLTFVLLFDARWDFGRPGRLALLLFGFATCLLYGTFRHGGFDRTPRIALLCFTAAVFTGGLICHGLLHARRPAAPRLTRFYLCMGLGGALGGWGAALLAPVLFTRLYELPIAALMVAVCALAWARPLASRPHRWLLAPGAFLLVAAATTLWAMAQEPGAPFRDFFGTGVVRVIGQANCLFHGHTLHGMESRAQPELPLGYYSARSPFGQAMGLQRLRKPHLRIGILGLGVGSAAAYGRVGDELRIYEISPAVIGLAGRQGSAFSAVRRSPAQVTVIQGDGRLSLERELRTAPNGFDLLLVDAFAGDQIPWHLLTREALALFTAHLAGDGILAFHVTNGLPIDRLVAANVQALDLWALELDRTDLERGSPLNALILASKYVLIGRAASLLQPNLVRAAVWAILPRQPGITVGPHGQEKQALGRRAAAVPAWTDARNSLGSLLWLKP